MVATRTTVIGRDSHGQLIPGCMTHAELVRELGTASGSRYADLVEEARLRMKHAGYPSFPGRLALNPE
jgi:hypothetical protein